MALALIWGAKSFAHDSYKNKFNVLIKLNTNTHALISKMNESMPPRLNNLLFESLNSISSVLIILLEMTQLTLIQ